jgi:hypothetical protein
VEHEKKHTSNRVLGFLPSLGTGFGGGDLSIVNLLQINPKIPGPFLPISTSKMLIISKKSPKKLILKKMLKFQPQKDYDLLDLLKKSCQKILKILTVVVCLSSCNPLWVLWNFRG